MGGEIASGYMYRGAQFPALQGVYVFREDVDVDEFIDAVDVALIKSKSGSALPSGDKPGQHSWKR
jgi:hypothetical protein